PDGRHGGDIQGIVNHVDYIQDLGIPAIWINPVVENNNPAYSYHGYAITDFYNIDPRYGTNDDYLELVNTAHDKGIKIVKDMVFNHCSTHSWLIKDLPFKEWVHQFEEFTRSNFRGSSLADPYASEYDKKQFLQGWFDVHMADLNQQNRILTTYLIQNSIWWIEYSGIDGIRVDTQPYSYPEFISEWSQRIFEEYPDFSVVGESWLQKESITAIFQKDFGLNTIENSGIPYITDFPLYYGVSGAFNENEGWTTGLARLYYTLAQDFVFAEPYSRLVFCDNHDLSRYYSTVGKDLDKFLIGITFIATTRGLPMIYYGSEILMSGYEHDGHGQIRKDFPGGWADDQTNLFKETNKSADQKKAYNYISKLLNWRKNNKTVQFGKLIQFVPADGIYVYFRIFEEDVIMVILNNNESGKSFGTERYSECLMNFNKGKDIITDNIIDLKSISIEGKSALVLELKK
ncbi:MAG: cyclomaltodextrinase C-terminal domain-containing protein, partial [Bacteroidales bacterium]|nr:cyclomaltodextrinase C-terminal domain-containing protein [Bacteroidales bacterium]